MIIDFRESVLCSEVELLKIPFTKQSLIVGDVIGNTKQIVIEIKNVKDFVASIIDSRLFRQAQDMMENYEKAVFVVIGDPKDVQLTGINNNAYLGALASLCVKNITVIFCSSYHDAGYLCHKIIEKSEDPKAFEVFIPVKTKRDKELAVLTLAEGISIKKAKTLLKEFGSISEVLKASPEELKKVKGIGDKLSVSVNSLSLLLK